MPEHEGEVGFDCDGGADVGFVGGTALATDDEVEFHIVRLEIDGVAREFVIVTVDMKVSVEIAVVVTHGESVAVVIVPVEDDAEYCLGPSRR